MGLTGWPMTRCEGMGFALCVVRARGVEELDSPRRVLSGLFPNGDIVLVELMNRATHLHFLYLSVRDRHHNYLRRCLCFNALFPSLAHFKRRGYASQLAKGGLPVVGFQYSGGLVACPC